MPHFLTEITHLLTFSSDLSLLLPAADDLIPWNTMTPSMLPLVIFILRTINISIGTVRVLLVARGQRALAAGVAALSATIFITTISGVLSNINNPWNILAYAGGLATGSVIGMSIGQTFVPGHSMLRITSESLGAAIAETLRQHGYGVTELAGQGMHSTVDYLLCFTPRRKVADAGEVVRTLDPDAFISVENVRQLSGGWQA